MIASRIRRTLSTLSVALLALTVLGVSPVTAATPSWAIDIVPLPATVKAGNDAGFWVTISNNGPSQINALSAVVTTDPETPWVYYSGLTFTPTGSGSCSGSPTLECSLGTLNAGASVSFVIAYTVPEDARGTFDLNVAIRAGTGDTGSDSKGKSRGDKYDVTAKTSLSTSANFDGGFVIGQDYFETNPSLTNRNIQSTRLDRAAQYVGVFVEDGITTGITCNETVDPGCTDELSGLFAEWSRIHVGLGATFAQPFKVTLVIRGASVPGGVTESNFEVVHVLDDGSVDVIDLACTYAGTDPVPTNAECRTVTKAGSNWIVEVWLFQNGSLRGGW